MNEIIKSKQVIEETGDKLLSAIDSSMSAIRSLESIESAKVALDEIRDFDVLLKAQRIQEALGDKLDEAKQKIAQMTIEIKQTISRLAQQSADDTMKIRAYERAGVKREEVEHIEKSCEMPEPEKNTYLAAKANERTTPTIKEMARIQRLPERERSKAFATIGDIAKRPANERPKFTPTVSSMLKSTEAKLAKDWRPKSPGAPAPAFKPELPDTYYPATQILVLGNQLHTKTTALMLCARRLTEPETDTGKLITQKELGELATALEEKRTELNEVAVELIAASRRMSGAESATSQ